METSVKFSDCSCEYLEHQFGLLRLRNHLVLTEWVEKIKTIVVDDLETTLSVERSRTHRILHWTFFNLCKFQHQKV